MESADKALDPEVRQISFGGKDAIKEALDARLPDRAKVLEFLKRFGDLRRLNVPSAVPVMELLKMGGISTNRATRDILVAMREAMLQQITTLDQDALEALLGKCYSYLTVPELASIPIATIDKLTYVDPGMWSQIVDNGLTESPYIDLPFSIKRRIWVSETHAFDHEIDLILNRIPELSQPDDISMIADRSRRKRLQPQNPFLQELMRMTQGLGEEMIAQAVDKMVDAAATSSTAKRVAIANLFHDFVQRLTARSSSNMSTLIRMGLFLDSETTDKDIDVEVLKEIREALSSSSSRGPVALLVASTYSRDFLAEQTVIFLLHRCGMVDDFSDESLVKTATQHLRKDPWIPHLTYLCLANMKSNMLLSGTGMIGQSEVEQPFEMFYPLIINEMYADVEQVQDNYFTQNGRLPHDLLLGMVRRGWLERRVLISYCLRLAAEEVVVGLARFRLLLDAALARCDQTEETREVALAYALIRKIIEG